MRWDDKGFAELRLYPIFSKASKKSISRKVRIYPISGRKSPPGQPSGERLAAQALARAKRIIPITPIVNPVNILVLCGLMEISFSTREE